jgi:ribonuclease R
VKTIPSQIQQSKLPSEAELIDFLRHSPGVSGKRDVARAFGLKGSAKIALKQMLKDLAQRNVLKHAGKRLVTQGNLPPISTIDVVGQDDDGDLYGIPTEWDAGEPPQVLLKSVVSQSEETRPPRPGDRILARVERLSDDPHYSYVARPLKNLSGSAAQVFGVYRLFKDQARIVSIDKKAKHDLQVRKGDDGNAEDGELVSADIVRDGRRGLPLARVRQRLGDVSDPRNISLIAIHQHGVPNVFPENILAECTALPLFSLNDREDYRGIQLVTIDPVDARDHDDAVFAKPDTDETNQGGHIVTVAIADVAAYVRPETALDREARIRGNSTYFPDRVVPMLPERISNDLCSLREGVDRPALAVVMVFDKSGNKKRHAFYRITMRSAAKLSYEEAQAAIDGQPSAKAASVLKGTLEPLWAAYHCMLKARTLRSPLELDLPERKIMLDSIGRIASVVSPLRLDAHKLIEEFMIQANVAAAEELEARKSPLLYRVHEEPAKEKIRSLMEFLKTVGQDFALGQVLHTKHFNRLLKQVEGAEFERVVHEVVLRTQAQAIYSSRNAGHFGLSLRRYAHFTSPIRRYADLVVHRALIGALKLGKDGLSARDVAQLDETAEMISTAERRSMLAERDTIDRLVASFMADKAGAIFSGRVSGAVSAGLFVRLDNTGADGFVPAATLGRDYYVFDEVRRALVGRESGEMFQLGDLVQVKLVEATPVKGGLKFEIVSDGRKTKVVPARNTQKLSWKQGRRKRK